MNYSKGATHMRDLLLEVYIQHTFRVPAPAGRRGRGDGGEGVISAAIAVLIFAFLGVIVWQGFKTTFEQTDKTVKAKVTEIGN